MSSVSIGVYGVGGSTCHRHRRPFSIIDHVERRRPVRVAVGHASRAMTVGTPSRLRYARSTPPRSWRSSSSRCPAAVAVADGGLLQAV